MKIPVFVKVFVGLAVSLGIVLAMVVVFLVARKPAAAPATPNEAAEQFILSLASHEYAGAAGLLAENLSKDVSVQDLQTLVSTIEAHQQGITNVFGSAIQPLGDQTTVRIEVQFKSGFHSNLDLPLVKEGGVWKVSSIDALWRIVLVTPDVKTLNG